MRFGIGNKATGCKHIIKRALKYFIDTQKETTDPNIAWDVRMTQHVLDEMDSKVSPQLMSKCGGGWLGAAREWMQTNAMNGESVTWGSGDALILRSHSLTVRDVEEFAARIASHAVNEDRENARF